KHHAPFIREIKMFISFGQHWSKRILANDINYHLERVVHCVTVCLWRLEKKIVRLLDKRREGRRLTPDLSVLRRTEIQQRAAVLIAGRLLADERIDAEIALLVDARRMTSWQRSDPGGGRIDLPDRRRRDGHWFVERWRRFQETAEFQRLQGRWRKV
ncbi:hypothetical protein ALC57_00765, partial [Trachymyrmex cornetzi]